MDFIDLRPGVIFRLFEGDGVLVGNGNGGEACMADSVPYEHPQWGLTVHETPLADEQLQGVINYYREGL